MNSGAPINRPDARLAPLLASLCEMGLTHAQLDELESLLHAQPGLRAEYVRHMNVHAMLVWDHAQALAGLPVMRQTAAPPIVGRHGTGGASRWIGPRAAALAAIILVAVTLYGFAISRIPSPQAAAVNPDDAVCAIVSKTTDVIWPATHDPVAVGAHLGRDALAIEAGTLRLQFASGTMVELNGPAEIRLDSRNSATLRSGLLAAFVPTPAHGFRVDIPGISVIDRGTEFGLLVDRSGRSQIHVLRGQVQVAEQRAGSSSPRPLPVEMVAGQARECAADGRINVIPFQPAMFDEPSTIQHVTFEGERTGPVPLKGMHQGIDFGDSGPRGWGQNRWKQSGALTIISDAPETQTLTFTLPPGMVLKTLTLQSDTAAARVIIRSAGNPGLTLSDIPPVYTHFATDWAVASPVVNFSVTSRAGAHDVDIKELTFGPPSRFVDQ